MEKHYDAKTILYIYQLWHIWRKCITSISFYIIICNRSRSYHMALKRRLVHGEGRRFKKDVPGIDRL